MSQYALEFKTFDAEFDFAQKLIVRTGRDLFAGTTTPDDRKAAARIAIVINKLDSFRADFERIYGEVIPELKPRKGKQSCSV